MPSVSTPTCVLSWEVRGWQKRHLREKKGQSGLNKNVKSLPAPSAKKILYASDPDYEPRIRVWREERVRRDVRDRALAIYWLVFSETLQSSHAHAPFSPGQKFDRLLSKDGLGKGKRTIQCMDTRMLTRAILWLLSRKIEAFTADALSPCWWVIWPSFLISPNWREGKRGAFVKFFA